MPIGDLLASITGEPSPTPRNASISFTPKRKSSESEALRRPADKIQRTSSSSSKPSSNVQAPTQGARPAAVDTSIARMKVPAPNSRFPSSSTQSPTAASPNNGQSTPPLMGFPAKPPKKGSYAEIMARGKQAQASMGQVGKIQHKRIEKLPSKREREEMEKQKSAKISKNIGPDGKFRNTIGAAAMNGKAVPEGRNTSKLGNGGKSREPPEPEKKIKKAALATTGYAGTARPKPGGGAQPTSRPSHSSSSRNDRDRYGRPGASRNSRYDSYADTDEDIDDMEEDDEGEDYASDVSSDMEAATFEVDEEEEMASRIARKEDAEALVEENRLKREKAEKKRRLMAMAKKRR